jgi:hypothetical protein
MPKEKKETYESNTAFTLRILLFGKCARGRRQFQLGVAPQMVF